MIVLKSSLKYFSKNYLQTLLALTGIVLGVSIVIAIDLCIDSSKKAFATSIEQSFGKSTHFLQGSNNLLKISDYVDLKVKYGIEQASPVIEKDLVVRKHNPSSLTETHLKAASSSKEASWDLTKSKQQTEDGVTENNVSWRKLTLLGIEPLAYKDFSISNDPLFDTQDNSSFKDFLLCESCAYLSKNTAAKFNIKQGDSLEAQIDTGVKTIKIIELLSNKSFDNLIITDISTAQDIFNLGNNITRVDMILPDDSDLESKLSDGLELITTLKNKRSTQQMLSSFNLNLYSLSFLSLIVAIFLIYNTMSFSTIQRQTTLGIFRTLGLSQNSLFKLIFLETLILSVLGSAIGAIAGIALSQILIKFISQTINDLYFVLEISQININLVSIAKGMGAGIAAAFIGAILPAYQASKTPAIQVTKRSNQESTFESYLPKLNLFALAAIALAFLILYLSTTSLILSFTAMALIIIAIAALSPSLIKFLIGFFSKLCSPFLSQINKVAIRSIARNLSRTSVAITALMIALSISCSLDVTVSSFRQTVKSWLESTLKSDVYISAPSLGANRTTGSFTPELLDLVYQSSVIKANTKAIVSYRNSYVTAFYKEGDKQGTKMKVASIDTISTVLDSFTFKKVLNNWQEVFKNELSVIISEPLAYKNNLRPGDKIALNTNEGEKIFNVLGVFYDYGSDQGIAMINRKFYQKLWQDYQLSSLGLIVSSDLDKDNAIENIKEALSKLRLEHNFTYRSNAELKTESLNIFDRTFRITKALNIISILIAFVAIISTLIALNIEKRKEHAVLRALGLRQSELAQMITIQSVFMGIIAAVLAIPTGLVEAVLLIEVINLRSFGWTLNFFVQPGIIFGIFVVAIIASLLASLYPALNRVKGALSLRND